MRKFSDLMCAILYLPRQNNVNEISTGDIMELDHALALSCIMGQIRDFANNRHRLAVMYHLESWLSFAEEIQLSTADPEDVNPQASNTEIEPRARTENNIKIAAIYRA
jgi:hypothetical protein